MVFSVMQCKILVLSAKYDRNIHTKKAMPHDSNDRASEKTEMNKMREKKKQKTKKKKKKKQ